MGSDGAASLGETVSASGSGLAGVAVRASWPANLTELLERERDRWFLWVPVLYASGIGLYFSLLEEPRLATALVPAAICVVLWLVFRRGTFVVVTTAAALALALGFAAAKLRTMWVAAPVLERPLNLADVRGWIELVEPRPTRGQRLTVRVVSIRGLPAERTPARVRIRTGSADAALQPGDPIRIRATLSPPAMPAIPGGFDFARNAYFMQLGGVGYALARPMAEPGLGPPPLRLSYEARITSIRQGISERIRRALPGERGGIADALITGERGGIGAATNQAYRDAGLYHILSISGLHMTIMGGAVFFLLRFLLALVPAIALRYSVKKWAAAIATVATFGYLMISGGSFATVRSWVMIAIMFLAVMLDRPAIALRNVAVSALLILAVLPESLLDIGFQMSYAAVAALVAVYEAIRDRRSRDADARMPSRLLTGLLFFGGIVLTTLIASFAVAPFGAYYFHTSQQYAIIANLIAIPVCNIVVMPGALATLVLMPLGLEAAGLWVMGIGIDLMSWCATSVAGMPGAVARLPAMPQSAFLLMVAGGIWLVIWRARWRLLGLSLAAAGLALAPSLDRPDVLVGHGGAALAARGADGRFEAIASKGGDYELSRWLEYDGDGRKARDVATTQRAIRCDSEGCSVAVKDRLVALGRTPSALADDCGRASVLILTLPRPPSCHPQGPAIDLYDLRDKGTHAVYFAGDSIRVVSVADARGERRWTGQRRTPAARRTLPAIAGSRLASFSPPFELNAAPRQERPELEDDDGP